MGPLDSGELHHVKLMEDNEDLRDVMQNELNQRSNLRLVTFLHAVTKKETVGRWFVRGGVDRVP